MTSPSHKQEKRKTTGYQAVVLAAGKSSRYWPLNKRHKSLTRMAGKTLLWWTIKALDDCGIKDIIVVHSPGVDIRNEIGQEFNGRVSFLIQPEPLGTGNALLLAKPFIKKPFLLIHPYKFFVKEIFHQLVREKKQNEVVFVGLPTDRPQDYGILRFSRGNRVLEICENPAPRTEPSNLRTPGIYFLEPIYFDYYERITKEKEDSLIGAFNLLIKEKRASAIILKQDLPTLKYPWSALLVLDYLLNSDRVKKYLAKSAVVGKNVVIKDKVFIGEKVIIDDNTVIHGPCYIANNCHIGASNVLRGPVDLEEGVVTGAFAEIKNCLIGRGTHVHSGIFGDSIIGENCRFGAGFVVANRRFDRGNIFSIVKEKRIDTHLTYFGFAVGDNTSFGVNSSIMPGVFVGSNCVIGPNSLVNENISDEITFYATFNNVVKKRIDCHETRSLEHETQDNK